MQLREPMPPAVKNMMIMIGSGVVAALLCSKVYGATLPLDEPPAPAASAAVAAAPGKTDDQAAALALRAMLAGQRPLMGVAAMDNSRR